MLIIATPDKRNLVYKNPKHINNFDDEELSKLMEIHGFQSQIYYITANQRATEVHQRKRKFATKYPITNKLRQYVPWQIWDKFVLKASLSNNDFRLEEKHSKNAIDLFVFAFKN